LSRRTVVDLVGRAGWSIIDQALSSLSNLLLSVMVARAVDIEGFGAFTLAFAVYVLLVSLSRALVSQPMTVRYAGASADVSRSAAAESTGSAAVLGLGTAACLAAAGVLVHGVVGAALVALAVCLPGLLVQDAWRLAFFSQGRPQLAALIDAAWTVLLGIGVAVLVLNGVRSAVPYLLVWGLAAALAAVLGAIRASVAPALSRSLGWLRTHWHMTRFLLFELLLVQGAFQGGLLLMGGFGDLADVAALRGAQVVLGPVMLLNYSALAFAVPELARRSHLSSVQRFRVALAIGAVLSTAGLVWGTAVLVLPDSAGQAVLGDSWDEVRVVLVASLVGQLANLVAAGPTAVIQSRGATAMAFRVNATVSVLLVVLGVGGLLVAGAVGAAWGIAIACWSVVPLWFLMLRRLERGAGRQPVGTVAGD
jgi:O-antigen/teichoic acid export membrane protein